jgi:hypothetical protein
VDKETITLLMGMDSRTSAALGWSIRRGYDDLREIRIDTFVRGESATAESVWGKMILAEMFFRAYIGRPAKKPARLRPTSRDGREVLYEQR